MWLRTRLTLLCIAYWSAGTSPSPSPILILVHIIIDPMFIYCPSFQFRLRQLQAIALHPLRSLIRRRVMITGNPSFRPNAQHLHRRSHLLFGLTLTLIECETFVCIFCGEVNRAWDRRISHYLVPPLRKENQTGSERNVVACPRIAR